MTSGITFATLLLMQGQSPVYVKEQLGHSSIKVTVDIYGHWIPGANRQAVNSLPVPGTLPTVAAAI
jgi:integrase